MANLAGIKGTRNNKAKATAATTTAVPLLRFILQNLFVFSISCLIRLLRAAFPSKRR
jgi:hypothetical protein